MRWKTVLPLIVITALLLASSVRLATALVNGRLLPGGTSPTTRVGGGVRQNTEWILAPNQYYLLRVTNNSGGTAAINTVVEWYEEAQ